MLCLSFLLIDDGLIKWQFANYDLLISQRSLSDILCVAYNHNSVICYYANNVFT